MPLNSLVYSLALATGISLLFFYIIKVKGPWNNYWIFAIILFLTIFGTALWIRPTKPTMTELHWIPPIISGFVMAFLLAAATPSQKSRRQMENEYEHQTNDSRIVTVSLFFWILLLMLFGLVIAGMFFQPLS